MSWRDIQEHLGIPADGIPGPQTADAVAKALGLYSAIGRKIGLKGLALIKQSEGLSLKAYPDPGTGGEPWTIGYGHAHGVKPGDVITEAQADQFLLEDVASAEAAVNRLCPITTQNQFDALVSFTFNLGEGSLQDSTLRRLHNEGDYAGAKAQFPRWSYAAGKQLPGLVKRRQAEAQLYGSTAS
jgi:lysozyme